MKKLYTILLAAFIAVSANAQEWTKTINALTNASTPNYSSPVITTSDNGVVVSGLFDQPVLFGEDVVENIATSSYVAKYSATGAELWMTPIKGAATVTAMTEFANGDIAVAGVYAGEVVIGETTLNGAIDAFFDPVTIQTTSFITILGADGAVKAVKSYVPSMNSKITGMDGFWDFAVFYIGEGPEFTISSLCTQGDKLIVGASLKGEVELAGSTLQSNIMFAYFIMLDDQGTGVVFSTDASLSSENVIATIGATEEISEFAEGVSSFRVAATADNVYAVALGKGNLTMTAGTKTQNFTFQIGEDIDTEYAYIVAEIGAETKAYTFSKTTDIISPYSLVGIATNGKDKVYVAGTFKGVNPFDNTITAKGESDIFCAVISGNTASVTTSGYKEGEDNKSYEVATCLHHDKKIGATVYGYVNNGNGPARGIKLSDQTSFASVVVNGVAGNVVSYYNLDGTNGYTQTITTSALPDAIATVKGTNSNNTIYDLQGRRTNNATRGLYIINGSKVVVK